MNATDKKLNEKIQIYNVMDTIIIIISSMPRENDQKEVYHNINYGCISAVVLWVIFSYSLCSNFAQHGYHIVIPLEWYSVKIK